MNTTPDPFFEFEWPVAPDYVWVEWLDSAGQSVRPSDFALQHPQTRSMFSEKRARRQVQS